MKDYLITDLSPLPKSNTVIILFETITRQIGRLASPFPCSSVSEDGHKTSEQFIEDMIVHNNGRGIPECLSPEEQHQAVQQILNHIDTRHRLVFREWPRPHADFDFDKPVSSHPVIKPENSLPGKMTPNGVQLWGSTLFDFFGVQRVAGLVYQQSWSTGSKLLKWCKANGEYEGKNRVADECIEWAEREKDPEVIPVYNVANLIKSIESSAVPDIPIIDLSGIQVPDNIMQVDDDSDAESVEENAPSPPSSVPTFASAAYFGLPFSKTGPWRYESLPVLEEYIPQSRLPRKLIVHDHWSLLRVRSSSESLHRTSVSWDQQARDTPHRVRTYELKSSLSSSSSTARIREAGDEKELRQKEVAQKRILDDFLANPHSSTTPRPFGMEIYEQQQPTGVPIKPATYVVVPPRPPLAAASEAHLYLSPTQYIGRGNHSLVYGAEWELPRSCLVEERICIDCIMEDLEAILREQDGENGETRDKKWDELTGMLVVKRTVREPIEAIMAGQGGKNLNANTYVLRKGDNSTENVYEGPYRVVHTRVRYQNLARAPYCEHLRNDKLPDSIHPLTTKVRVTAKLSIKYDTHLAQEAKNYQQFPKHFFEHWSGYNILPPIHDPVPLGPLVPQFYGYYVPTDEEHHEGYEGYLSPILLLEHCGVPIQASSLSVDDKNECAGLGLRLHEADWYHGSFSQRNILRKPGPLSAHPEERDANRRKRGGYGVEWSFRLIDFGRSRYDEDWSDGIGTEHQVVRNWGTGLIAKSALG